MSWRRASTILAMLAALSMAPPSVSAAPPNTLTTPSVLPSTGTDDTPFVLTVIYHSSAGNSASAVTATVAGQTIPMSLALGTPVNGVWTVATMLPAGSWTVKFEAVVDRGPTPAISGGTVTVIGSTPSPAGSGGSTPSDATDPTEPGATPQPNPVQSPSASAGENAPTRGADPTTPAAGGSPDAVPASARPGASDAPRGGGGGGRPAASPDGSRPERSEPAVDAGPIVGGSAPMGDSTLQLVLIIGLAGVAAVALLGAAWIAVASRRERAEPSFADGDGDVDPAIRAIPTVEQRALRRARLTRSNDPIIAALGLPEVEAPRAPDPRKASPRRRRVR